MLVFLALLGFSLAVFGGLSSPEEDIPTIEPEYLDMLLKTNQHELFNKVLGIDHINFEDGRSENPMFNKELIEGDILPRKRAMEGDEERQILIREHFPDNQWSNNIVPYVISYHFNDEERCFIEKAIRIWNCLVECVKFVPRTTQTDYIYIIRGDGCYSLFACQRGVQPLSLGHGCLSQGTILHEMEHAVGCHHEQTRQDRDDYIAINWENIPEPWWPQYNKTSPHVFRDHKSRYDYYSLMHYPIPAPGTGKPAFDLLDKLVDPRKVGHAQLFSPLDLEKLKTLYCR